MRPTLLPLRYILAATLMAAISFSAGAYSYKLWSAFKKQYRTSANANVARAYFEILPTTGKTVFFGDSLTAQGHFEEHFPCTLNRGIAGETTADILSRLDTLLEHPPRAVFIMAGINDILQSIPSDQIFQNYAAIIRRLRDAGIPAFVQSTLLTSNQELNARVSALNNFLTSSTPRPIDLNSILAPDGYLAPVYTVDGIHLSTAAYLAWIELLDASPELEPLLAPCNPAPNY